MPHSVGTLLKLLRDAQQADYIGEPISQLDHALQCAERAVNAGAADYLVAACLLHDIGHLVAAVHAERMGDCGVTLHHEIGAQCIRAAGLDERSARLVELHVDAKRYLVARSGRYRRMLSSASRQTLSHQGGPMSRDEAERFEGDPLFADALRLRAWDDHAKVVGKAVRPLSRYRALLQRLVR